MYIHFDTNRVSLEDLERTEMRCVSALEEIRERIAEVKRDLAEAYTINPVKEVCVYDYVAIAAELQQFVERLGLDAMDLGAVRSFFHKHSEIRPLDPSEIYPCPNCREFELTIFNDEKDDEKYIFCTNCAYECRKLPYSTSDDAVWSDFCRYLIEEGIFES